MNVTLDDLRRIAEVEFNDLIVDVESLEEKVRLFIADTSYIDVWLSRKLPDRFGYHWERGHIDSTFYRYDNFPNTAWRNVETYPRHFHNGSQTNVEAAPFSADILEGFRDFLRFVKNKKTPLPDEIKSRVDLIELDEPLNNPITPPDVKSRIDLIEPDEPPDNPITPPDVKSRVDLLELDTPPNNSSSPPRKRTGRFAHLEIPSDEPPNHPTT